MARLSAHPPKLPANNKAGAWGPGGGTRAIQSAMSYEAGQGRAGS